MAQNLSVSGRQSQEICIPVKNKKDSFQSSKLSFLFHYEKSISIFFSNSYPILFQLLHNIPEDEHRCRNHNHQRFCREHYQ